MSPIVIASQAAHLNGGEPDTRTFQVLPRHRLRLAHSRHTGRTSALFGAGAFSRVQGFGGRQTTTGHRAPILFFGLGRALQPRKQSRSGFANALHLPRSFQNASASYEQEIIGAFGNVRKAFGEIRNVEC